MTACISIVQRIPTPHLGSATKYHDQRLNLHHGSCVRRSRPQFLLLRPILSSATSFRSLLWATFTTREYCHQERLSRIDSAIDASKCARYRNPLRAAPRARLGRVRSLFSQDIRGTIVEGEMQSVGPGYEGRPDVSLLSSSSLIAAENPRRFLCEPDCKAHQTSNYAPIKQEFPPPLGNLHDTTCNSSPLDARVVGARQDL